jgi:hypothetical protein
LKVFSKTAGLLVLAGVFVYATIYADVILRARDAFSEGEKYMAWSRDPSKKAAAIDEVYQKGKSELDQQHNNKKMSDDDYAARLASLEFEKNFQLNESSLKYAYQWYKDTYELFSPPESKWVKEARIKAPEALALWKQELRAKNIPFDDSLFE